MKRIAHRLGPSQLGTERTVTSLHYGTPDAGQKAYLQASLHADEVPGMLVMHHLIPMLDAAEAAGRIRGEVVLVPFANPIGLDQRFFLGGVGRFDAASGENFNRGYPEFLAALTPTIARRLGPDEAGNRETIRAALRAHVAALPEPTELACLRKTLSSLACDADVVLDLHCDHEAVMHLYCEEPYWSQCEPLARLIGARSVLLAKDSGGASFDETMGGVWWQLDEHLRREHPALVRPVPLACLSVTVELRGQADVSHALAERDARALVDFLTHRGIVAGTAVALPPLACVPTPLAGSEDIVAPHAGVIAFAREVGDTLEAGDHVADIVDPLSGRATAVRTAHAGVLYARYNRRYAAPGVTIAHVAGAVAFRSGNLLSP